MATKAIINNEQDINDGMAEIELQRLQRQYRIMEGDRKAYSEESRILIGKQRSTIDKLKKENEYLQDELKLLEERNEDRRKNGIQGKKAESMAEQAETLQKKIKDVLDETVGLDTEIAHINVLINENRAKLGGANASRHNNSSIDKQVRVLENRLEKALVKFNKGLAVNKRLRVIINNLRRERLVFDNVYHKFEKGLLDQKKSMADIIETSNAAYEARDEAQTKVIGLREKAEKEYQNYVQEIKELDRALEHDRRLKEFMATKTAHRTLTMSAQKGSKKEKETVSSGSADEDNFTVSLDTYENAFMKIRKVTGISDIGELVERFKQVEDKNFSLFNYVSEVNNEIELSAEETLELVAKIDKLKIEEVTQEEMRKQELHKFEKQLQEFTDKKKVCAEKNEEMAIISGELTKGIESLIKNLQETARQKPTIGSVQATAATGEDGDVTVEPPVISKRSERLRQMIDFEMPSDNLGESGVSEENLVQFLGLIEQKSNELLTLNYICNSPRKVQQLVEGEIQGVGGLLGQGPGAPIGNFTIVAPGTGDDHDSGGDGSDEDERPLTREEIKQRTLRGLNKRERTANLNNKQAAPKGKRKPVDKRLT